MTQLTDTVPISATRLMDVAREITLQLGEFQHHPHLMVTTFNRLAGRPHITFGLVGEEVPQADQSVFLDQLATILDTVMHVTPDWIGDVRRVDYQGTGVTVTGGGRIAQVES